MYLLVVLCGSPFRSHDHSFHCSCYPSLSRWARFQQPQAPRVSLASLGRAPHVPFQHGLQRPPRLQEARSSLHTYFTHTYSKSVPSRRAFYLQNRGRNQSQFLIANEPVLVLLVKSTELGVSQKRQEERVLEDQDISFRERQGKRCNASGNKSKFFGCCLFFLPSPGR